MEQKKNNYRIWSPDFSGVTRRQGTPIYENSFRLDIRSIFMNTVLCLALSASILKEAVLNNMSYKAKQFFRNVILANAGIQSLSQQPARLMSMSYSQTIVSNRHRAKQGINGI